MLLNRYVQYCKCKESFERRKGNNREKRYRVRQTATHISYLAAYGPHPVTVLPLPFLACVQTTPPGMELCRLGNGRRHMFAVANAA